MCAHTHTYAPRHIHSRVRFPPSQPRPTANMTNSHPEAGVPPTNSDRRKQFQFNQRPPAVGVYKEPCQIPLSWRTNCADFKPVGRVRRISDFQKRVDPRGLFYFNTVFPKEPGVGGVGVGSSFLVPDIFQRSKLKHNALRVISKASEELHVLLISITAHATRL